MRNKNFREELEEDHPSLDGSVAEKSKSGPKKWSPGQDEVATELDSLNGRFSGLEEDIRRRMESVGNDVGQEEAERIGVKVRESCNIHESAIYNGNGPYLGTRQVTNSLICCGQC